MFKRLRSLAPLAAVVLLVGAPTDGHAQAVQETPDREELVRFTEAFVEVSEVRNEMTPQILEAESQEEAAALEAEAQEQMIEALDEHDLGPDRYNAITQQLNSDQELREEFEAILEEITGPGV